MAEEYAWRFSGELICDWVDDDGLAALAEQLDVNPPVERLESEEAQDKAARAVKVAFKGIGAESSGEFSAKVARASTYRSASPEVRLRRVLDRLLDQHRLFDLVDTFAPGLSRSVPEDDPGLSSDDALERAVQSAEFAGHVAGNVFALVRGRDWVVAEGWWELGESDDSLTLALKELVYLSKRREWPANQPVTAQLGKQLDPNRTTLTSHGRQRLVAGRALHATVFGAADRPDADPALDEGETRGLRLLPLAVFDRKGGDWFFTWRQSARLRAGGLPPERPRGRLARVRELWRGPRP